MAEQLSKEQIEAQRASRRYDTDPPDPLFEALCDMALASLHSAQEPVAWEISWPSHRRAATVILKSDPSDDPQWTRPNLITPLYTAPPPPEAMLKELEEFRRVYPTLEDNELRQAIDALLSAKT